MKILLDWCGTQRMPPTRCFLAWCQGTEREPVGDPVSTVDGIPEMRGPEIVGCQSPVCTESGGEAPGEGFRAGNGGHRRTIRVTWGGWNRWR